MLHILRTWTRSPKILDQESDAAEPVASSAQARGGCGISAPSPSATTRCPGQAWQLVRWGKDVAPARQRVVELRQRDATQLRACKTIRDQTTSSQLPSRHCTSRALGRV